MPTAAAGRAYWLTHAYAHRWWLGDAEGVRQPGRHYLLASDGLLWATVGYSYAFLLSRGGRRTTDGIAHRVCLARALWDVRDAVSDEWGVVNINS